MAKDRLSLIKKNRPKGREIKKGKQMNVQEKTSDYIGGNDSYNSNLKIWQLAKRHNDKSIAMNGNKTSRRYVKPSNKRIPLL